LYVAFYKDFMRLPVFTFLLFCSAFAQQSIWNGVGRVVAVGDVHGDFRQFVGILRGAGLIDCDKNWIGGKTHLVQTGDVPDRGPDSRAVLNLIARLEKQAPLSGGRVHFLIGNHELMLMQTDLRYVHEGEILSYGGLKEMVKTMHPDGQYGRWLASHNSVIRINNALFVHAGLALEYSSLPVWVINETIRKELRCPGIEASELLSSSGPLWFRGYAEDRGSAVTEELTGSLAGIDCDFTVIGHSVSISGIVTRFGGRVVMIDTGMSECYGGTAQYLELDQRGYKAQIP
jgi:hypothetical protein